MRTRLQNFGIAQLASKQLTKLPFAIAMFCLPFISTAQQGNGNGATNRFHPTGNAGIGTTDPTEALEVIGNEVIHGNSTIKKNLEVKENVLIQMELNVKERVLMEGVVDALKEMNVQKELHVGEKIHGGGGISITGPSDFNGPLNVFENAILEKDLTVKGNVEVAGSYQGIGDIKTGGNLDVIQSIKAGKDIIVGGWPSVGPGGGGVGIGIGGTGDIAADGHVKIGAGLTLDWLASPNNLIPRAIGVDNSGNLIAVESGNPWPTSDNCNGDETTIAKWIYGSDKIFVKCPPNPKVGIGTEDPTANLSVIGTMDVTDQIKIGTSSLYLGEGSDYNYIYSTSKPLVINDKGANNTGAVQNTYFNPNGGQVGIGTKAPHADNRFEVTGTMSLGSGNSSYPVKAQLEQDGGSLYMGENIYYSGGWKKFDAGAGTSQIVLGKNGTILFNTGSASDVSPGTTKMTLDASGNVGIGTTSIPTDVKLKVKTTNNYAIVSEVSTDGAMAFVGRNSTLGEDVFRVYGNGKVQCKEVKVTLNGWSDFVFADDYKLRSLNEVENYIKENKHLPDVPSENEVITNGTNLGEMDALLLQKIEELTLYVIELQKEINELKVK